MIIKINQRSEIPLYLQLRNQIVTGIGKGALKPGNHFRPYGSSPPILASIR